MKNWLDTINIDLENKMSPATLEGLTSNTMHSSQKVIGGIAATTSGCYHTNN